MSKSDQDDEMATESKHKEFFYVEMKYYAYVLFIYVFLTLTLTWTAQRHLLDEDSWQITRFYVAYVPEFRFYTLIADVWLIYCIILFASTHCTQTQPMMIWPIRIHYCLAAAYHLLRAIYYVVIGIVYPEEISVSTMFVVFVISLVFCIFSILWFMPLYTYQKHIEDINPVPAKKSLEASTTSKV